MALPNLRSFSVHYFEGGDRGAGSLNTHPSVWVCPMKTKHEVEIPTTVNERMETRPFPVKTPYGFIMPSECSSITDLKFDESPVSSSLLSRILTLPNRLESFEYEIGDMLNKDEPFAVGVVFQGLEAQASSLKRLVLSIASETAYKSDHFDLLPEDKRRLNSLTKLVVLEHLSVPVDMVLGPGKDFYDRKEASTESSFVTRDPFHGLLPLSLARLELELVDDWELEFFLAKTGIPRTLQRIHEALPALRTVVIHDGNAWRGKVESGVGQRMITEWRENALIPEGLEIEILGI